MKHVPPKPVRLGATIGERVRRDVIPPPVAPAPEPAKAVALPKDPAAAPEVELEELRTIARDARRVLAWYCAPNTDDAAMDCPPEWYESRRAVEKVGQDLIWRINRAIKRTSEEKLRAALTMIAAGEVQHPRAFARAALDATKEVG